VSADEDDDDGLADEDDEGLAAERTSLAWGRTSLALLACGAAVLRGVPAGRGVDARPGVGAVIVALAAATWVHSLWNEHRRRTAIAGRDPAAEASSLRSMARSTGLVAVVAFALASVG